MARGDILHHADAQETLTAGSTATVVQGGGFAGSIHGPVSLVIRAKGGYAATSSGAGQGNPVEIVLTEYDSAGNAYPEVYMAPGDFNLKLVLPVFSTTPFGTNVWKLEVKNNGQTTASEVKLNVDVVEGILDKEVSYTLSTAYTFTGASVVNTNYIVGGFTRPSQPTAGLPSTSATNGVLYLKNGGSGALTLRTLAIFPKDESGAEVSYRGDIAGSSAAAGVLTSATIGNSQNKHLTVAVYASNTLFVDDEYILLSMLY